jgi:hypothetical protein
MDGHAFDRWVASAARDSTRRGALRLLAGGLLGGLLSRAATESARAQAGIVGPPREGMILTCADAGLADCPGYCADLLSDPYNCGGCGVVCGGGQACAGGVCIWLAPLDPGLVVDCTPQGLTNCGGNCVDLAFDAFNCGACGNSCPLGGACQDGACAGLVCLGGLVDCGVGYCIDIYSDPNRCGGCEFGCYAGYDCVNGQCV